MNNTFIPYTPIHAVRPLRPTRLRRACIWQCLLIALALSSCAEEELTPDYRDPVEYFKPTADDHSEVAEARRQFFAETGSYVIFNDTLQHYPIGIDVDGNVKYFTERLDLGYSVGMTSSVNQTYYYKQLQTEADQLAALEFTRNYLVPHFSTKLKPFCWYLASTIQHIDRTTISRNLTNDYAASGQRSIAVACDIIPRLTDGNRNTYINRVLSTIIMRLVADNMNNNTFDEFYAVSARYYSGDFTFNDEADNTHILRQHGFIGKGKNSWGITQSGYYPDRSSDINAYASNIAMLSVEQIENTFRDYPLVIEKFMLLRRALEQLGYAF